MKFIHLIVLILLFAGITLLIKFQTPTDNSNKLICSVVCNDAGMEYVGWQYKGNVCICKRYGKCVELSNITYCQSAEIITMERQDKIWS